MRFLQQAHIRIAFHPIELWRDPDSPFIRPGDFINSRYSSAMAAPSLELSPLHKSSVLPVIMCKAACRGQMVEGGDAGHQRGCRSPADARWIASRCVCAAA